MKHGKHAKGFQSMIRLRAHPIIGARDFYYSNVIYEEEIKLAQGANYFTRLWECFSIPRCRRANYGASTVMIAQQMCGINSRFTLVLSRPSGSADILQSSPSTVQVSLREPGIQLYKRYTRHLAMVPFKFSLPFLPCSSSIPKGVEP